MKVREYTSEDSLKVKELILSILEKEYPFDRSIYNDSDVNDITGTYKQKGSNFYVALEKDRIVGCIGIKKEDPNCALLRRFFVNPAYRRKGIGTVLLKEALSFCKKNGYREIVFRATSKMKEALKLLKKHGFLEKESYDLDGFFIHRFILKL